MEPIFTTDIRPAGSVIMKNGVEMSVDEIITELKSARHFKYPVGTRIYSRTVPEICGTIVAQIHHADEGAMYMIKTDPGHVSAHEFIGETDARRQLSINTGRKCK